MKVKMDKVIRVVMLWMLVVACGLTVWVNAEDEQPMIDESASPEVQGQQLATIIRSQVPIENYQTQGTLTVRSAKGQRQEYKISSLVYASPSHTWTNIFQIADLKGVIKSEYLIVRHPEKENVYFRTISKVDTQGQTLIERLKDPFIPIGNSDFMMGDMGFEFLFWPKQVVVRQQIRSGRTTYMLESSQVNPEVYSKIICWVDKKTLGPMRAEAYDKKGELIKIFTVGGIKEINGEKVISRFDMENLQSRFFSRIEFNE